MNKKIIILISAFILSLWWVLFCWQFFSSGVSVLGFNAMIFFGGMIVFYCYVKSERGFSLSKETLAWVIPLSLIAVSFFLFSNPYNKWISFLVFPIIFFGLAAQDAYHRQREAFWGKGSIGTFLVLFFTWIGLIFSVPRYFSFKKSVGNKKKVLLQVFAGLVIFLVLGLAVIVPLLSSVDPQYASFFKTIGKWLAEVLKANWIAKVIFLFLQTMVFLGLVVFWRKGIAQEALPVAEKKQKQGDSPIVAGIVLGGVLLLYLLFIIIQLKSLFIGTLPVDFSYTESFVKSGFWQLFCLTLLNILLYILVYRRYSSWVGKILILFTLASLLLAFSATHRVFLYVYFYGLSYEKFYAFYTVVFCSGIFLWLVYLLFNRRVGQRANIFRQLFLAALWGFAILTILPMEKMIFKNNLRMTAQENSRIDINEMRVLGVDALSTVERNWARLMRHSRDDYFSRPICLNKSICSQEKYLLLKNDWQKWTKERRANPKIIGLTTYKKREKPKYWFEKTAGELLYTAPGSALEK